MLSACSRRLGVAIVTLAVGSLASSMAAAETCAEAFSAASANEKDGRLTAAKDALLRCAATDCPASMRKICTRDLAKVEERTPTLVVAARDDAGTELPRARITIDGVELTAPPGRAVPVDPGVHRVAASHEGHEDASAEVVVLEGEKARPILVTLPRTVRPRPAPPPPPPVVERPIPASVYVGAGVTLVAAGVFTVLGVKALGSRADIADCRGSCPPERVDPVREDLVIADVALAVTLVAAVTTTVLYLTRPTVTRTASVAAVTF